MPRPKRTERLNLTIDQTLKRQFDAICALRGLSMSEINQELIAKWVKENAPPGMIAELTDEEPTNEPRKKEGK